MPSQDQSLKALLMRSGMPGAHADDISAKIVMPGNFKGLAGAFSVFSAGKSNAADNSTIQTQWPALAPYAGVQLIYSNMVTSDVTLTTAKIAAPTSNGATGATFTWTPVTFNGSTSVVLPACTGSPPDEISTRIVSDFVTIAPNTGFNSLMVRSYFAGIVGTTSSASALDLATNITAIRTITGLPWYSDKATGVIADASPVSGSTGTVAPDGIIFYYSVPTVVVGSFGGSHLRGNTSTGDAYGFIWRACILKSSSTSIYSQYQGARGGSGQQAHEANLSKTLTAGIRLDVAVLLSFSGNDLDFTQAGYDRSRAWLGKQLDLCAKYNVRPIVCTVVPVTGDASDAAQNARRHAHNRWVLTLQDHGIQVCDIATIYEDPTNRSRINPLFLNSGDNLHANDNGQQYSAAALAKLL